MQSDLQPCRHQLKRPPDLVKDVDGVSFLLFECLVCGCGMSLQLDSEGNTDGEFMVPLDKKCA